MELPFDTRILYDEKETAYQNSLFLCAFAQTNGMMPLNLTNLPDKNALPLL